MRSTPTLAIVGRPNVGKSAIFNRMVGRRIAIVHDQPGVTRDRLSAPCRITDYVCDVMDTGGIGADLIDGFTEQVAAEADIAMATADIILFVLDCRDDLTSIDQNIATKLHSADVPVLMLLNKADHDKQDLNLGEFASLGFDNHVFISAAHGRGMSEFADILNGMLKKLGAAKQDEEVQISPTQVPLDEEDVVEPKVAAIKVAVVGKPNAGKSSLINAILKDQRSIVSNVPGTTRDAIDIPTVQGDQEYIMIDTAGMRQRSKRDSSVEIFSAMRSEKAVRRSDICLLVIDIATGVTAQDRRIGGQIAKEGKPCIIVVNKFDLYHPSAAYNDRVEFLKEHIRSELFFLSYAPFVVCSALKEQGVENIFKQIQKIRELALKMPTTGLLNRILATAIQKSPPKSNSKSSKRLKLFYATCAVNDKYTTIPVPTYVLFVNDKTLLSDSYAQYLRNVMRQHQPSLGIPIIFSPRSRVRKD